MIPALVRSQRRRGEQHREAPAPDDGALELGDIGAGRDLIVERAIGRLAAGKAAAGYPVNGWRFWRAAGAASQ